MLSSWHDLDHVSPWSWYDHGKIMPWQPYFSKPGVILKLLWNKNLLSGHFRKNFKSFWSILCSILLIRRFGGIKSSRASQMWHIMVFRAQLIAYEKIMNRLRKHAKHDDPTMIMVWILKIMIIMPWIMATMSESMATMPASWHDHDHVSPWSWYDHGMAAMFFEPEWMSLRSQPGKWEGFLMQWPCTYL